MCVCVCVCDISVGIVETTAKVLQHCAHCVCFSVLYHCHEIGNEQHLIYSIVYGFI